MTSEQANHRGRIALLVIGLAFLALALIIRGCSESDDNVPTHETVRVDPPVRTQDLDDRSPAPASTRPEPTPSEQVVVARFHVIRESDASSVPGAAIAIQADEWMNGGSTDENGLLEVTMANGRVTAVAASIRGRPSTE